MAGWPPSWIMVTLINLSMPLAWRDAIPRLRDPLRLVPSWRVAGDAAEHAGPVRWGHVIAPGDVVVRPDEYEVAFPATADRGVVQHKVGHGYALARSLFDQGLAQSLIRQVHQRESAAELI